MALRKKPVLWGIILVIIFGITVVYLRLWTIDSSFSSEDREALRKEFDRANMEALDESANWRMRYDGELERSKQCLVELLELKEALTSANSKMAALQRENTGLNKQVETLRGEVETKKWNCNCNSSLQT